MRIIARGDSPAYESVGWVFPRARLVSVNKHSRTQVFPLEWLLEVKQRRGSVLVCFSRQSTAGMLRKSGTGVDFDVLERIPRRL
jgi:hypothetical protein